MLALDSATRAEYDAETTAEARAAVVLAALTGTVSVVVYDAGSTARASGTLLAPWATVEGNVLTIGETEDFSITSGGTPAGWTLRFESGDRWVEGSFGLDGSGAEFTWSLPDFETGSVGTLGEVVIESRGVTHIEADFAPTWSVFAGVPQWVIDLTPMTWAHVPNTALSPTLAADPAGLTLGNASAYAGAAQREDSAEIFWMNGGAQFGSSNAVYSISLLDAVPTWELRRAPTGSADLTEHSAYYLDGRPSARASYWNIQYHQGRDLLMFFGAAAVYGSNSGFTFPQVDAFDPDTNDYLPADSFADFPASVTIGMAVTLDDAGNCYALHRDTGHLYKWTSATDTWADLGSVTEDVTPSDTPLLYDPQRSCVVRMSNPPLVIDVSGSTPVATTPTPTGITAVLGRRTSAIYCEFYDSYLVTQFGAILGGNAVHVYRVDPDTWDVTDISITGTAPTLLTSASGHTYGRLLYVPTIECLAFLSRHSNNVVVVKLAALPVAVTADYTSSWDMAAAPAPVGLEQNYLVRWNVLPASPSKDLGVAWNIEVATPTPDDVDVLRVEIPLPFPLRLKRGTSYDLSRHIEGGRPPYTFTLVRGSLPTGTTLSSAGVLRATTTATLGQKFPSPTELTHDTRAISNDLYIKVTDSS